MDLVAYCKIGELEHLLTERNIEIPRLRGLELCSEMTPWEKEEIADVNQDLVGTAIEHLCAAEPVWCLRPDWRIYGWKYDLYKGYYTKKVVDGYDEEAGFERTHIEPRWDRIHGKHRNTLKYAIKLKKRNFLKYYQAWDKYAGRTDVIRVHSRIGGNNWLWYGGKTIEKQPWFLEKVDDYWDSTYCDIYVYIGDISEEETKKIMENLPAEE